MADFFFNSPDIALGSPSTRFENNKQAILTAKALQAAGRPATLEEQEMLSRYVGWGDSRISTRVLELEKHLTQEELRSARASTLNAHYTSLPVIAAIWEGIQQMGFGSQPFTALDPSAGIGHFKSMTPASLQDSIEWTEVELDPLTASILKALHPSSRVFVEGFEEANLPEQYYDLAVTNVPFGDYGVSSRKVSHSLCSPIHDFFFANTHSLLRPGGVLMYITSRYTLDKKDARLRSWLARRFDLLAAARLPDTAFKKNAGTEVVTDILVLRKRNQETSEVPSWVDVEEYRQDWRKASLNRYFMEHPEMMLGKPSFDGSMYHGDAFTLSDTGLDLYAELTRIFRATLPVLDFTSGQKEAPRAISIEPLPEEDQSPIEEALMAIHDAAKQLLRAEAKAEDPDGLRQALNDLYDAFTAQHGSIGEKVRLVKNSAAQQFLKSLEKTNPPSKADIFFQATVRSSNIKNSLTASDALLVSLDQTGKVDICAIASSLGISEAEAIEQLRGAIYREPITKAWQTSEQYLSGNVREKLRQAQAAVPFDPAFQENIMALESALPLTIQSEDIRVPLGAGWVPEDVIADFLSHLLDKGSSLFGVSYVAPLATWDIKSTALYLNPQLNKVKWGTNRIGALELLDHILNSRAILLYDGFGEDRTVNQTETVAAQAKALEIGEEFERWLWSDPARSQRLAELYNETFNALRAARYYCSHLSTPGLNNAIHLRSNQKDAAWRIIQTPSALIGHEVGMGKTLTAIVAAMESKRLGLTRKAMIVVPNHTLVNWQAVLQIAYPGANVLYPPASGLSKSNRSVFMSRVAVNEWDMILVPFSSFKLLPTSSEAMRSFYDEQISELEEFLWEVKGDSSRKSSEKEIQKALKRFRTKLQNLDQYEKDAEGAITFDQLGVDFLIVDEFHAFKNLYFNTRMTRVAGLSNSDSQRAFDMFIKSRWLLDHGGKFVGLTGTPITNSIAEMFTMQRYFQMDSLRKLGLNQFDAWARQFALAEPGLEMTPDGAGFRMNTRFRRFVNLPELMQVWLQTADMRRVDPAEILRPELYGPIKAISYAGQELRDYVGKLAERAEKVRKGMVRPDEDNMLCVTGDGRKAALDLSLVVPAARNADMPKVDGLSALLAEIHSLTKAVRGVQLVFCDLATPKARKESETEDDSLSGDTIEETRLTDNIYGEIKLRLAKLGLPAEEVAFIHDASNPRQREELFQAVNEGKIRVLIGSNEKMGTGLNVQERCIAVHHLTPPWRPGDLEQQLGRMLRWGNLFPQVFQFVHVTSGSFDGYTWQLLENKAGFIAQIMSGSLTEREAEDIGDSVLTFSQIKALASGNPKVMQKITLDAERQRMNAVRASWLNGLNAIRSDANFKTRALTAERQTAEDWREAIRVRDANVTDEFFIELRQVFGGDALTAISNRAEAGRQLNLLAAEAALKVSKSTLKMVEIGRYKGHRLYGSNDLQVDGTTKPFCFFEAANRWVPFSGTDAGILRSLDFSMQSLDRKLAEVQERIAAWERDLAAYEIELSKPWDHDEKLQAIEAEVALLDAELKGEDIAPLEVTLPIRKDDRQAEERIEALAERLDPETRKLTQRLNGIGSAEVLEALSAIRTLLADPATFARFNVAAEQPIPIDAQSLDEIGKEIQKLQALYDLGQAVQFSLFGDPVAVSPRGRRHK